MQFRACIRSCGSDVFRFHYCSSGYPIGGQTTFIGMFSMWYFPCVGSDISFKERFLRTTTRNQVASAERERTAQLEWEFAQVSVKD